MFSQVAGSILKKRLRSSPKLQESIDEAASQYLGKAAKIDTAMDSVFAHDLCELAKADRKRVANYAAATVPGNGQSQKGKGKNMEGDFIVCDDYRKGTGTLPAIVMGVVATMGLGVGAMGLWMAMSQYRTNDPTPVIETTDEDTHYILELVP